MTGTLAASEREQHDWRCGKCGAVVSATNRPEACPHCDAVSADASGGP